MKTLKMLALIVAITFSSAISASTNSIDNADPKSMTETISELLKNPRIQFDTDVNAMVIVTVNQNNELVVLSVDTQNEVLGSFIKKRLNYKEVPKALVGPQRTFKIPVKIISSK